MDHFSGLRGCCEQSAKIATNHLEGEHAGFARGERFRGRVPTTVPSDAMANVREGGDGTLVRTPVSKSISVASTAGPEGPDAGINRAQRSHRYELTGILLLTYALQCEADDLSVA